MEGLTGALYRQAHCRWFGCVDRYFIPFITPTQDHRFTKRELREILPEHNRGLAAVPQLLVRRAEDFLWAAGELAAMGYPEINLNLGCPSGTVVAKGKGSGFLGLPEELERFLDTVFDAAPCAVSIKTRLGLREPEESGPLLALFRRYPLAELIVHPRVLKDYYGNKPRLEWFGVALSDSRAPVCYNGDICNAEDLKRLRERFPKLDCVMVGRGVLADPALGRVLKGGGQAEKAELRKFHDLLYRAYCEEMSGDRTVLYKMKELWFYFSGLFTNGKKYYKKIKKCERCVIYESIVNELFMKEEVIHG